VKFASITSQIRPWAGEPERCETVNGPVIEPNQPDNHLLSTCFEAHWQRDLLSMKMAAIAIFSRDSCSITIGAIRPRPISLIFGPITGTTGADSPRFRSGPRRARDHQIGGQIWAPEIALFQPETGLQSQAKRSHENRSLCSAERCRTPSRGNSERFGRAPEIAICPGTGWLGD